MKPVICLTFAVWILLLLIHGSIAGADNLTCYQCIRKEDVECGPEFLLPCSSKYDRCVTHITKYKTTGFVLKRECGLGPCDFNDSLMNNNLGMKCDRSKEEFSCLSCCRGNGCNKNAGPRPTLSWSLQVVVILIVLLDVIKNYQPPYLPNQETF